MYYLDNDNFVELLDDIRNSDKEQSSVLELISGMINFFIYTIRKQNEDEPFLNDLYNYESIINAFDVLVERVPLPFFDWQTINNIYIKFLSIIERTFGEDVEACIKEVLPGVLTEKKKTPSN